MKKNILIAAAFLLVATTAGYIWAENRKTGSDKAIEENVEALASEEGIGDKDKYKCYSSLVKESGASVVECSTCQLKDGYSDAWYSLHDYCYRK